MKIIIICEHTTASLGLSGRAEGTARPMIERARMTSRQAHRELVSA
jgi:hypothetical protein